MNNSYTYNIICPNGKQYYGYRSANKVCPEEDLWKVYFTSSDPVKELRIQYNDDSLFVATIDKTFETADDARAYEEEFLTENGCVKSDDWLNRANHGKEFCTPEHLSEEHKKSLSIAMTGKPLSEKHKKKISIAHMGLKHTEKSKKKMSIAKKGKPLSKEHKKNLSITHMGKPKSKESIEKRTATRRKNGWNKKDRI